MSKQERDTHFIRFARLLIDELIDFQYTDDRPRAETVIAQRAYDLARHVIKNAMGGTTNAISIIVSDVPDMTDWPVEPAD